MHGHDHVLGAGAFEHLPDRGEDLGSGQIQRLLVDVKLHAAQPDRPAPREFVERPRLERVHAAETDVTGLRANERRDEVVLDACCREVVEAVAAAQKHRARNVGSIEHCRNRGRRRGLCSVLRRAADVQVDIE